MVVSFNILCNSMHGVSAYQVNRSLCFSLNFIIYNYIRVVVTDSSVIQYLVYFTLFMERECTT